MHLLYVCAFGFIGVFTMSYFSWMIQRFLADLCPEQKYSCIRVYKRNVITLKQTAMWYLLTVATGVIDRTFEFLAFRYQQQFSRQVWFLLWTLKGFIIYEGFYFFLPFTLNLPQDWIEKPFFITKHEHLEPRISDIHQTEDKEAAGSTHHIKTQMDKVKIVQVEESMSEEENSCGWSADDSIFDWTDYSTEDETCHRRTDYRTRCWVQGMANDQEGPEEKKDNLRKSSKNTQNETKENIKIKQEYSTRSPKMKMRTTRYCYVHNII